MATAPTGTGGVRLPLEEINATMDATLIHPDFGQVDSPVRTLDSSGQIVGATDSINLNPVAVDISAAAPSANVLFLPTATTAAVTAVVPTAANNGMASGSRLSMPVNVTTNPFSEIPVMTNTSRTTQDSLKLNIQATCFPTNLRAIANPVSPNAKIKLKGTYSVTGSFNASNKNFSVEFPASAVMMGTGQNLTLGTAEYPVTFENFTNPIASGVAGNLVSVHLPSVSFTSLDVNTGTITQAQSSFQISNLEFSQTVPPPTAAQLIQMTSLANYQAAAANYLAQHGSTYWLAYPDWKQSVINQSYMGLTGPIGNVASGNSGTNLSQSADGKTITISASLPGDLSMCGGYYSPLMVFFDKDRPRYENITNFKMKHDFKTYWPEKNHAGYFLGLLNKNGKIENYKDLFGESENIANGFESLSKYDSNHDGVINSKDKIFKKLVLWKDSAGLGKFSKKDILYVHKKIKSIQLKYNNNFEMVSVGAEYRQRSTFTFVENKKIKTGEIIDVWFKPAIDKSQLAKNQK